MKNRLSPLSLLLALILAHSHLATAANYRRSGDFPPLKLTYDSMSTLLEGLHNIVPPPETQDDDRYTENKVTFADGEVQVDIDLTNDFQIKQLGRLPPVSYNFDYSFARPHGKIDRITIRFSDYERKVSVKGTNPDQVNAVYGYLANDINKYTTWIGGLRFRSMGGSLLFTIALSLYVLSLLLNKIKPNMPASRSILLSCFGAVITITTLALPYDRWLPGFAMYPGPPSFLVRYSAQISFFSVVLGIVSIILTCIFSGLKGHRVRSRRTDPDGRKIPTNRKKNVG